MVFEPWLLYRKQSSRWWLFSVVTYIHMQTTWWINLCHAAGDDLWLYLAGCVTKCKFAHNGYILHICKSIYYLMLAYIWIHSSLLNVEYNILLYQLVHVILTCCLSGVHGLLVLTVTTKDLKFSGSRRTVLPVWTPEDCVVMATWKSGDVSWTLRTDHPPPKRLLRSTVWARDSSMLSKLRDTVEGKRRRQEGETT